MISLHIDDIVIGERLRALSTDAVARLAGSMRDIGLRHPISVRVVEEMELDGRLTSGVPVLVAGAHRLAAAKELGWSHIDCIEVEDDPVQAELWELAENLHRCDLTKEQRDAHFRRYAELVDERRAAVCGQVVQKPGRPKETAAIIAEETGFSQRTIRRALNPPAPRPVPDIKMALEPESEHDAITREANAIVSAWNRARQEARELALQQIDGPVFDRSRSA